MKKWCMVVLAAVLLSLCSCDSPAPSSDAGDEVSYEYSLRAGEQTQVRDVTFAQDVTVVLDPASTRDGAADVRSEISFENCRFEGSLTIVGDYHAMIRLESGCSFAEGCVVNCEEVTPGAAREATLEDNLIKVFAGCEGVCVETESAVGVLSDGPAFAFNGTTYSKSELSPDTDLLGVYGIYEGDEQTYIKLGIGEDDSMVVLN